MGMYRLVVFPKAFLLPILLVVIFVGGCTISDHASKSFNRHGVPSEVPLPNGLTWSAARNDLQLPLATGASIPDLESLWQVASPMTPAKVQQFYLDTLPGKGWTHIQSGKSTLGGILVGACQSTQIFFVQIGDLAYIRDPLGFRTKPLYAPPGGSAITIDVGTSTPPTVAAACIP